MSEIKIIETPRDGFQGIEDFIPTEKKIDYINKLLEAGFDTVEAGSFVSSKAIPQMSDTAEVLKGLTRSGNTKVMVLVGNERYAEQVKDFDIIDQVLFPFSVSETFLKRNINSDFTRSKDTIKRLMDICHKAEKELIVYLTMGFGNPYGDPWSVQAVVDWNGYLIELGLKIIPLSDILGDVTPKVITDVYSNLIKYFPEVEFGIHLHVKPDDWYDKVDAAWKSGVRRFDSVNGGFGGCPMANDELVSNLDTLDLISYCEKNEIKHGLNNELLSGFSV